MSYNLKGRNVNVFWEAETLAASTSCTFELTANTADATSKSDPGDGEWDNSEFLNYNWKVSNESFMVGAEQLGYLISRIVDEDATFGITFECGKKGESKQFRLSGMAIITQMQIQANLGDFVKISLSFEGCSALVYENVATIMDIEKLPRIKGKALMVAIKGSNDMYHTIAAATSHTLTLNVQTSDSLTKDDLDGGIMKVVTGKSVSLSSENMLRLRQGSSVTGLFAEDLLKMAMEGKTSHLAFGYYPMSIGTHVDNREDWNSPSSLLLEGDFICSSIKMTGNSKEDATYSAEFTGKGMPSMGEINDAKIISNDNQISGKEL